MKFRLALIQSAPTWGRDPDTKEKTFAKVERYVKEAKANGADIVSLPEMWHCPYTVAAMKALREPKTGASYAFMRRVAKENHIWLIGGSVAEQDGDYTYNTCFVFNADGEEVARHRKNHLFGIDVPGQTFDEREVFSKGDGPTVFDTPFGRIGVAICFDVRFRDPIEREALDGAELIVLPASFGTVTGRAHWTMLIRSRAVENQLYFAGNNAAFDPDAPYSGWGHSTVYDPWGDCILEMEEGEGVAYADIDTDYIRTVREKLPVMARKFELDRESKA